MSGGYHRRTYGNLAVTDNLNLGVDEWSPFTITAPLDDRLPGGGGYPITMYTLNANKVGTATDNLRTFSTKNARTYNGVDLNVNARIGASAFLLGGITHERSVSTTCDQRDNPNSLRFCDSAGPVPHAVQDGGLVRAAVRDPGQRQLHLAAGHQRLRELHGHQRDRGPADHRQHGGRDADQRQPDRAGHDVHRLPQHARSSPGEHVRGSASTRLQGLIDIYNLLNAGTVTTVNTTFGAVPATRVWNNPQTIQTSRYVRFGAQLQVLGAWGLGL